MNFIDRNGRLFGKISVIDVLVIGVVLVMAAAGWGAQAVIRRKGARHG